jgi:acetylornithine deacetylase
MTVHHKIVNELSIFPKSSLTIANIKGGTADNIVPDYAEAVYSMRISPGDENDYIGKIKKIIGDLGEMEVGTNVKPMEMEVPEKLKFLGSPEIVKYCTDLSFLDSGLVLGPGDITYAHSANEFVPKRELEQAVEIYEKILQKMSLY